MEQLALFPPEYLPTPPEQLTHFEGEYPDLTPATSYPLLVAPSPPGVVDGPLGTTFYADPFHAFHTHLDEVVNPCWNFAGRISTEEGHQMNAMVGLASEAGELLDQGKKLWFHTPVEDNRREKILSELGDCAFYFLKVCDVFGFSLEEVLANNRVKLASRHPEMGQVTERFGPEAIR